jgi:chemotaxis protein methyltransferase CheR
MLSAPVKTASKSERQLITETEFSDLDFQRFRDLIRRRSGLFFNDRRRNDLKAGVLKAFHYSSMRSLGDYYEALSMPGSDAIFKTLVSFLTVGETYFFRHFDVIEREILPRLIRSHQHDRTIRIWSAGCSTGEEPFSVAMVLHHLLPDIKNWNISIVATDINVNSLQYAREGVYRPWSLRSIPTLYKERYFDKNHGLYELSPAIRSMVQFDYLNLVDDCYPSDGNGTQDVDLLFCRNVTIYFEAETTIKVIDRFYRTLKDKAYLAVGHAEPSSLIYDEYETEIYPDAVIYRKDPSARRERIAKTGIRIRRDFERALTDRSTSSAMTELTQKITRMAKTDTVEQKTDVQRQKIREKLTRRTEELERHYGKSKEQAAERRADMTESELFDSGVKHFHNKAFAQAVEMFEQVIAQSPSNGRALYMLGHIHANLNDVGRAIEYCQRAIEQDSLLIEAYYLLGLILKEENRFDESVRHLKKAIYIDLEFAVGYYELAVNYFKRGDAATGKKYIRETMRILKKKSDDERVGIFDDLTVRELKMMCHMWEH